MGSFMVPHKGFGSGALLRILVGDGLVGRACVVGLVEGVRVAGNHCRLPLRALALAGSALVVVSRLGCNVGGVAAEVVLRNRASEGVVLAEWRRRLVKEVGELARRNVAILGATRTIAFAGAALAGKVVDDRGRDTHVLEGRGKRKRSVSMVVVVGRRSPRGAKAGPIT